MLLNRFRFEYVIFQYLRQARRQNADKPADGYIYKGGVLCTTVKAGLHCSEFCVHHYRGLYSGQNASKIAKW